MMVPFLTVLQIHSFQQGRSRVRGFEQKAVWALDLF